MIAENNRAHGEFYVDQTGKHALVFRYQAKVYEIRRYIGWGTLKNYENFQRIFKYWNGFCRKQQPAPQPI